MPGVRDRNLRSGDLHEELGLVLLRAVALVAPVPRPEDVGTDAFATLVRPDGSRRLLPDVSFLVQLKAASVSVVSYEGADAVNWVSNLEIPLFIGRVNLVEARIELFSTLRLHQILLETRYDTIRLLLDPAAKDYSAPGERRVNIGPPVHSWSLADADRSEFLTDAHGVLRPHVEALARNRRLRDIQSHDVLQWETGKPPVEGGRMMLGSPSDDIGTTLQGMAPHVRRLLFEIQSKKRYAEFPTVVNLVQMMRKWGVDPDPDGLGMVMAALGAEGPEISDEVAIHWRYQAGLQFGHLNLSYLTLLASSLEAIPGDVTQLALIDVPLTDTGLPRLLRLTGLTRLNLSGTAISDAGLDLLGTLTKLCWLGVERTAVTDEGVARLKNRLPHLEVKR